MAMKPTDHEVSELYQEAGASGPSVELDQNILMAARAAVEHKAAATWWSRWRLPLQAFATICLVVMVTVLVERRDPLPPAIPPLAMNSNGPAAERPLADSATPSPAPGVAESRARMADQAPARARSEAKMSAPEPVPAAPAQEQASEAVRSPAPTVNSITAAPVAAAPMPLPEAGAAPSAKAAARMAADQAMAPSDWLDSIQTLIKQNRLEEARKRLEAFVQAYPNEAVPEAIKAKLKAERANQP
jgi:hypothetical protein